MERKALNYFVVLSCGLALAAGAPFFLERFDQGTDNGVPKGWQLKQWAGGHDVREEKEEGRTVVHLISTQDSFGIVKKFRWNTKVRPKIHWRWKVTVLPKGGDVRVRSKDDQAAQLYIVFPRFPSVVNSRLLGYIWESTAPQGGEFVSTKYSKTRYIVLESGATHLGKWITEERNVYEDYKRLFHEEPPEAAGITLMINSENTESRAEGYFGEIEIP